MSTYHYSSGHVAIIPTTDAVAENRTDGVLLTPTGTAHQALSWVGTPISFLTTGPAGIVQPFTAEDLPWGYVEFGNGARAKCYSDELMNALTEATAARSAAEAAQAAAEACIAKAFPISNVGIDPDGTPYVSDEPVANGGVLVINQDGSVDAVFPY